MSCQGCGEPRSLTPLLLYYDAARKQTDPEKKLAMALELCHSLIIELGNHIYCMHGERTNIPDQQ